MKKCDVVVGHLSKGKTEQFAKTISFFLRRSKKHSCKVEVTGKRGNFGSGYKDSIYLVNSIFTGDAKFIDKLKDIIPTLL